MVEVRIEGNELLKTAQLIAAQGSWRWQVRIRPVTYRPTRLRDGRLVWASPCEGYHYSGGNQRSRHAFRGEPSPIYQSLTPTECAVVYAYGLAVEND